MSARRVLRYEIPIDDAPCRVPVGVAIMACPWRQTQSWPSSHVEMWIDVETPDDWPSTHGPSTWVQVFGTGQAIPRSAKWLASCIDGALVWHIYELGATI